MSVSHNSVRQTHCHVQLEISPDRLTLVMGRVRSILYVNNSSFKDCLVDIKRPKTTKFLVSFITQVT